MFLAETGYAASIFAYVDESGCLLWALVFVLSFGPLTYVNFTGAGPTSSTGSLCSAVSRRSSPGPPPASATSRFRFRKACQVQGHRFLPRHVRRMGLLGALGPRHLGAHRTVLYRDLARERHVVQSGRGRDSFFQSYLALLVVVLFYIIGYAWKSTPLRRRTILI